LKRAQVGWQAAVIAKMLTDREASAGRELIILSSMPELVASGPSDAHPGNHFVYLPMPWLSAKGKLWVGWAIAYAPLYPDALPVVDSVESSSNSRLIPEMGECVNAPRWAVDHEDGDWVAAAE
jgi:hypothetical protein